MSTRVPGASGSRSRMLSATMNEGVGPLPADLHAWLGKQAVNRIVEFRRDRYGV